MKQIYIICCLLITSHVYAQDSVNVNPKSLEITDKTTITIQPVIQLGYLHGGCIGIGIKYNELVAIEANYGLDFPAAIAYVFFFYRLLLILTVG
ncbi:MAG: hypothetical protein HYZ54_05040 [Ignavibacteriae bacterium]|nr:hypothetical protein [Ignavibacteriota bacterium]